MLRIYHIIVIALLIIPQVSNAQKLAYSPVKNTTVDESFPIAAKILTEYMNVGISVFDYGNRTLLTTHNEYYRGLTRAKGRWYLSINEEGTLDIQIIDIYYYNGDLQQWEPSSEGLIFRTERKMRASLAEDLRTNLADPKTIKECQDWFYSDIEVNSRFYENATELAGDRWFETYLKNEQVSWKLNFVDIKKNDDPNQKHKYKEIYTYTSQTNSALGSTSLNNVFYIVKYTNDDSNVLRGINEIINVAGYCRSLDFTDDVFYIIMTDKLEDNVPSNVRNSVQEDKQASSGSNILDVAGQLKDLKELLDLGAITQEEYDTEKSKLLGN